MSIPINPLQKSPERAFALQKYLLLHSQHDALQKHLESISQSPSSTTSTSSPLMSTSPTSPASFSTSYHNQRRHRRSSATSFVTPSISPIAELPPTTSLPSTRPELPKRRSSLPSTLSASPRLSEIEEEELKLLNVNQQIKATLTELLNCESVRKDRRYRMWIQTRLMDAERELKDSRSLSRNRRRSVDVGNVSANI
jgi:hypothetical protein